MMKPKWVLFEGSSSRAVLKMSARCPESHRPTTTPEVLGTQVVQMAFNDHGGVFYWSGVIVIATVVTGASCYDPTGGWPKVDFSTKSFSESGRSPRVGWPLTTSEALGTQRPQMAHNDHGSFLY